jgi:cytoplasmic tRNA 2-thiolation protein 2
MPEHTLKPVCVECRDRDGDLNIRNRRLCSECFSRYVNSKILKRMESYRFKTLDGDQRRRLLVPLSGGVSSLVLLQVLDAQLRRQITNRNKTAYDLIIAHVVLPDQSASAFNDEQLAQLIQRFSGHSFLPKFALHALLGLDETIEQDLKSLGYQRQHQEPDVEFFNRIMSSTASVTTHADLQSILLRRLLVAIAKAHGCQSIIWGHSDSRLAALALAEVAKGRGGSVPSTIADGPSPFGVNFNHPLRDLFKAELDTYASILPEPLVEVRATTELKIQPPPSLRNTAIDSLLTDYINTQGLKYPSIMANVVRTAGKLEARQGSKLCQVCVQPILSGGGISPTVSALCYGCERMKQDIKA